MHNAKFTESSIYNCIQITLYYATTLENYQFPAEKGLILFQRIKPSTVRLLYLDLPTQKILTAY